MENNMKTCCESLLLIYKYLGIWFLLNRAYRKSLKYLG